MKRLWIDGHFIEVTDEVYTAYVKGQRKMDYFEKDLKTERVIKGKDGGVKKIVTSRKILLIGSFMITQYNFQMTAKALNVRFR